MARIQMGAPILEMLDKIPPFLALALARGKRNKRPRLEALVAKSGIPRGTFVRLARSSSWADVKVKQIDGFLRACGIDPFDPNPQIDYLREALASGKPFAHLTTQQQARLRAQCEKLAGLTPSA